MAPVNIEYLPEGQSLQADTDVAFYFRVLAGWAVFACLIILAPVVAEYLPAGQSLHIDADAAPVNIEYLPEGQSLQVDADVAFLASEYLPAGQSSHVLGTFGTRGCRVLPLSTWLYFILIHAKTRTIVSSGTFLAR